MLLLVGLSRTNRRVTVAVAIALVLGLLVGGCVTPSIPIPPPEPEQMSFAVDVASDSATFAYGVEPNYADAVVYVFNRRTGTGIITTARGDGSVGPTQPFPARVSDQVTITFETDETVVGTCVTIQANGSAGQCL